MTYVGLVFEVPRARCIEVVNFYVNTLQSLSLQYGDDEDDSDDDDDDVDDDDDDNYDSDGTR